MAALAPIAMSQTKEDLLKHLNLPRETYALMAVCTSPLFTIPPWELTPHLNFIHAKYLHYFTLSQKETDVIYNWLISDKAHLKENSKRKAPYDWSDIQERAKDDAMAMIAQRGDQYTAYYWDLGTSRGNSPNWVAKWFLYHKFRYRDGRNRNQKGEKSHDKHGSSSKHKHASREHHVEYINDYQQTADAGAYSRFHTSSKYPHLMVAYGLGHLVLRSSRFGPATQKRTHEEVRN